MVSLCFKLFGNSLHSSHTLPICPDVRLNSFMFTGGSFNCTQVSPKVVLTTDKNVLSWQIFSVLMSEIRLQGNRTFFLYWIQFFSITWDTSLWFSLSHVSRIAAFLSKRAASISSFSWRISSFLRASSRSCSAFSRRSHAYDTIKNTVCLNVLCIYGEIYWTLSNQKDFIVTQRQSKCYSFPVSMKQIHLINFKHYEVCFHISWWKKKKKTYFIDIRDEFALPWHVNLLVVCSHLALDSEEKNLQVSFLCKSAKKEKLFVFDTSCCFTMNPYAKQALNLLIRCILSAFCLFLLWGFLHSPVGVESLELVLHSTQWVC